MRFCKRRRFSKLLFTNREIAKHLLVLCFLPFFLFVMVNKNARIKGHNSSLFKRRSDRFMNSPGKRNVFVSTEKSDCVLNKNKAKIVFVIGIFLCAVLKSSECAIVGVFFLVQKICSSALLRRRIRQNL